MLPSQNFKSLHTKRMCSWRDLCWHCCSCTWNCKRTSLQVLRNKLCWRFDSRNRILLISKSISFHWNVFFEGNPDDYGRLQGNRCKGEEERFNHLKFVLASSDTGIAFGNAGCAAVHALACLHRLGIPRSSEANAISSLLKCSKCTPKRNLTERSSLQQIFADCLGVDPNGDVYGELEKFLNKLIIKKPLREYGMVEAQIDNSKDDRW